MFSSNLIFMILSSNLWKHKWVTQILGWLCEDGSREVGTWSEGGGRQTQGQSGEWSISRKDDQKHTNTWTHTQTQTQGQAHTNTRTIWWVINLSQGRSENNLATFKATCNLQLAIILQLAKVLPGPVEDIINHNHNQSIIIINNQ